MRRWLVLFIVLWFPFSFALAQTWSAWNGITVGSTAGNIGKWNGITIGATTGNIGKWNNLTSPSGGGGGPTLTLLGTFKAATNASTTFSIPVAAGEASGKSVVIAVAMQTSGGALNLVSATDNAGTPNTYNLDIQTNNTTDGYTVGLFTKNLTSSIPSSTGSITVTISAATSSIVVAAAYDITGPQFSSGTFLDGTPGTFHSQNATSGTATASAATANDIAISAWEYKTADTLTVTTGYTAAPSIPETQTGRGLYLGTKLVSSGGAVAATGSLSATDDLVGVVAGYNHP